MAGCREVWRKDFVVLRTWQTDENRRGNFCECPSFFSFFKYEITRREDKCENLSDPFGFGFVSAAALP